jgi:hypothetical protein
MRWVDFLARMREMRKTYIILADKNEQRRQLGRPRIRWEAITVLKLILGTYIWGV